MNSDRKKINKIYSQIDKIALKGKDNYLEYCQYIDDSIEKSDYDNLLQCLYYNYYIDIEKLITVDDVKNKTWNQIRILTNLTLAKKIKKLYDSKNVYQTSFDMWSQDPKYFIISISNPLSITYSSASASAGIDVTRSNSTLSIDILNPKIYEIVISKTTWTGTPSMPSNIEKYQEIIGITQSSYELEIPTSFDTQWLINTKERAPFRELNYKFNLSTNKYLGQIIEIDNYNDETKYLIKNRQFARITKTRRNYLEVSKVISYQPLILDEPLKLEDYDYSISDDENMYRKYVTAVNLLTS
jgi:hypothetical protein